MLKSRFISLWWLWQKGCHLAGNSARVQRAAHSVGNSEASGLMKITASLLLGQMSMSWVLVFCCSESTFFAGLNTPWQWKLLESFYCRQPLAAWNCNFIFAFHLLLIVAFQSSLNICLIKQVQPVGQIQPACQCVQEKAEETPLSLVRIRKDRRLMVLLLSCF